MTVSASTPDMLKNQLARGNNGLIKTKYLTFAIDADSIKAAQSPVWSVSKPIYLITSSVLAQLPERWTVKKAFQCFMRYSTWMNNSRFCLIMGLAGSFRSVHKGFYCTMLFQFRDRQQFRMGENRRGFFLADPRTGTE